MELINFRDYHLEKLKSIEESTMYLKIILEEFQKNQDSRTFLLGLRDIAEAQGVTTVHLPNAAASAAKSC